MKTQPALQLLQVPPALGSTGTQGRQSVGGFAEILQQSSPEEGLVKDLAIAALGKQALDSTAAQAGSPNGWVVPNQVEPDLPVLIAASEEGPVPVALATGVSSEALAYGGEPEASPSDLLGNQPRTTAYSLGQPAMTTLDVENDLRNEVLLAAATQSVAMEINTTRLSGKTPILGSSDTHNMDNARLDLASKDSALNPNGANSNLQEATLNAQNASSKQDNLTARSNAMSGQSLARDEVLTNAPLRSDIAKNPKALFRRPTHEPTPHVSVRETTENVGEQLVNQAITSKPKPTTVIRSESKSQKGHEDKAEPELDRFNLDQEPLDSAFGPNRMRLGDQRSENLDSRLESLDASRNSARFMEEVEAEFELLETGETEVLTQETVVQRPTNMTLDVDVDEELSLRIDARGQEVSVTLDGTNSALEDLKNVGKELAESLRRMGFDLSEFNAEERNQSDKESTDEHGKSEGNATNKSTQAVHSKVRRGHRINMTA